VKDSTLRSKVDASDRGVAWTANIAQKARMKEAVDERMVNRTACFCWECCIYGYGMQTSCKDEVLRDLKKPRRD
jgi:hypothetical protein